MVQIHVKVSVQKHVDLLSNLTFLGCFKIDIFFFFRKIDLAWSYTLADIPRLEIYFCGERLFIVLGGSFQCIHSWMGLLLID